MDQFDDWLQRVSEGKIDRALQNAIADKILELLEQKKGSLGTRGKILFAEAITELSINVNSIHHSTETSLRRCLVALQKATNPENEPDETNDEIELINYQMLVSSIEKLKRKLS